MEKKVTTVAGQTMPGLVGFIDRIDESGLGGWVTDFSKPGIAVRVRVLIDQVIVDVIKCDMQRDDVAALKLPTGRIGFYYNIPERFHDGLRHVLKFATIDGVPITMGSRAGRDMAELQFCLRKPLRIEGLVDGMVDGLIQGWALRVDDRAKTQLGGLKILVTIAGQPVAELLADQYRADVAQARQCEAACGFSFVPAPELRTAKRSSFRFFVLPGREELHGSPVDIVFPEETMRDRMAELVQRADELFAFAYHLRKDLKALLPTERYLLSDYPRWVARSAPLALARSVQRYGAIALPLPLVSVVCPVFRPQIPAFLAAVDSVRQQSFVNWELLIVDDASKDLDLTAAIAEMAAVDRRIRPAALAKNSGISRATNRAIAMAKGQFIAFFDHDDLLDPFALEIMVMAQAATHAKLVYSDEDKVDQSGALSEPHFKPDFNYRFLLEVNYICHFVMVEADILRQAGGLDARLDGAQDHDLLLRLSEMLDRSQIHHVPEILYHWRKSAGSSAAAGVSAKPKAAQAGVAAVSQHLARRNLAAAVKERQGITCYRVDWLVDDRLAQAGVSILVPFRDHAEMTARCVAAIRKFTSDVRYEIVLLDNWSTAAETERFLAGQANHEDTRIVRVAEPFNFSRINNIGTRAAMYDFVLFMNNDVIASEPGWLRSMLNECLVDERVAAVGAKLLYPAGTVQHAGVVLGVGGVADHAFRGIAGDAPGYVMRAMASQEISAVTAACMLVRKTAFDEVGGFDEQELAVAFNDVDLCVKFTRNGWKVVLAAEAVLEHQESVSRGDDFDDRKVARFMFENEVMRQRYPDILPHDPFYNPNFSREGGVYRELRVIQPKDA
jgi:GT2 family glycosyltransferase